MINTVVQYMYCRTADICCTLSLAYVLYSITCLTIRHDTYSFSIAFPLNRFGSIGRWTIVCRRQVNKAESKVNSNTNATKPTQRNRPTHPTPTPLSWLSLRSLCWGEGASGGSASSPPAAAGDGSRFVNTRRRSMQYLQSILATAGSGFRVTVPPPHSPT